MSNNNSRRELGNLIKARYPLIWCVTPEEQRVMSSLTEFCRERRYQLAQWSMISGFKVLNGTIKGQDRGTPIKAIDYILNTDVGGDGGVFVLCDFHPFLKDVECVRKLREMVQALPGKSRSVVIVSPVLEIPREMDKEIAVLDWDLPNRDECGALLDAMLQDMPQNATPGIAADVQGRDRVIDSLLGLTHMEIDNVLSKTIVKDKTISVPTILGEKKHIIRKSGILEFYEAQSDLNAVGGQEVLKGWLRKRRHAFTSKARTYGLPAPKGLLLVGVPGCGKSLTAKAVSAAWGMPCLRLDIGKVFAGLVGASEENIRKALKTAEAVAPAVLWLDELEKAFAGTERSTDSGASARVFSTFLTWMQEKTAPVFVIATANDVSGLPPELLRKGRFDEIFYADLPTPTEREEILRIHLTAKGRDVTQIDVPAVVQATNNFTGSEIEQVVISALYEAYDKDENDRTLTTAQLLAAAEEIVPLAQTMRERIAAMREWARTRARAASNAGIPTAPITDRPKGRGIDTN